MIQTLFAIFFIIVLLSPICMYCIIMKNKKNHNTLKQENYMIIFNGIGKEMDKQNEFLKNKLENIDFNMKKNNLVIEKLNINKD